MNPFEMVVIIVVDRDVRRRSSRRATAIVSRDWATSRSGRPPRKRCGCATRSRELKERFKVLERITVEKENSLAREIEDLRDR